MALALSVPLRSLDHDAAAIAHDFATRLALPQLDEPLRGFIAEADDLPALRGLVLASFADTIGFANLSIHALADFRALLEPQSPARATRDAIRAAHHTLDDWVRDSGYPLATSLWLANTSDTDIRAAAEHVTVQLLAQCRRGTCPLPVVTAAIRSE